MGSEMFAKRLRELREEKELGVREIIWKQKDKNKG